MIWCLDIIYYYTFRYKTLELWLMISWLSQTTLLKLPGPVDLLYSTSRRSGPFSRNYFTTSSGSCLVQTWLLQCSLAGLPANSIKPLQLIQNAAARLIFNEPKRMHVTSLFINLHWLPIAARIKFKALMFAYRTTSGSAPLYLNSLLQTYVPSRSLHRASERSITVPSQRDTKSLSQTFSLTVPIWWNDLELYPSSWILTHLQETAKNTSLPSLFDPLTLALSILILFIKNTNTSFSYLFVFYLFVFFCIYYTINKSKKASNTSVLYSFSILYVFYLFI